MAFPQVVGSQNSQQTTNATTSNVTLPAGVAAGDLILAFIGSDLNASVHTWPSPWVRIRDVSFQSVAYVSVAYLIASGGETTVAVTHTSEQSNHIAIRISAASWDGTTPPEIGSASVSGLTNQPDPPSYTASWGAADNLWIACIVTDAGGAVTAWPYADNRLQNTTATSAAHVAICTNEVMAATENPGTFTITTSDQTYAVTLVVRPSAAQARPYINVLIGA